MKLRHSAMLIGLAIAAWLAFFADKSPSNTIAEPTRSNSAGKAKLAQPPKPAQLAKATSATATVGNILPIIDRRRLIAANDSSTVGVGEKARVFAMQSWMASPPPPPKRHRRQRRLHRLYLSLILVNNCKAEFGKSIWRVATKRSSCVRKPF